MDRVDCLATLLWQATSMHCAIVPSTVFIASVQCRHNRKCFFFFTPLLMQTFFFHVNTFSSPPFSFYIHYFQFPLFPSRRFHVCTTYHALPSHCAQHRTAQQCSAALLHCANSYCCCPYTRCDAAGCLYLIPFIPRLALLIITYCLKLSQRGYFVPVLRRHTHRARTSVQERVHRICQTKQQHSGITADFLYKLTSVNFHIS